MGAGRGRNKRYSDVGCRSLEKLQVYDSVCTSIDPIGVSDAERWWFETLVEVGWNIDLKNGIEIFNR